MILYQTFYSSIDKLGIIEASRKRPWMDSNVHSYKCTPLAIANEYGWDIVLPYDITVNWDGGKEKENLIVNKPISQLVKSHFGSGTITINPGFNIKTDPDIYTMIIPTPNEFNNQFSPLTAIVETDKLEYPWFLTIRFLNTGESTIKAGTKIARILPINITASKTDLIYKHINTDSQRLQNERAFAELRRKSQEKKERWTKHYINLVKYTKIKMKILNDTN